MSATGEFSRTDVVLPVTGGTEEDLDHTGDDIEKTPRGQRPARGCAPLRRRIETDSVAS